MAADIEVRINTVAGFIKEREKILESLKERKQLIDTSIPEIEKGIEEDKAHLADLVKERGENKP